MKTGTFVKRFARQSALKGLPRPVLKSAELQKISDDAFDNAKPKQRYVVKTMPRDYVSPFAVVDTNSRQPVKIESPDHEFFDIESEARTHCDFMNL